MCAMVNRWLRLSINSRRPKTSQQLIALRKGKDMSLSHRAYLGLYVYSATFPLRQTGGSLEDV